MFILENRNIIKTYNKTSYSTRLMARISKYSKKKDPKITYLLGAGASYNSIPIWSEQGDSMNQVAEIIKRAIENPNTVFEAELLESKEYNGFNNNEQTILNQLVEDLNKYALKAEENDTIDSYAFQLFKRKNKQELFNLKRAVSIYLDIWQFYRKNVLSKNIDKKQFIDTRYIKWLNMITESNNVGDIKLKPNVNILSWNYDLQVELAFARYYDDLGFECLNKINEKFNFLGLPDDNLQIHHLNGHHGYFEYEKAYYPTGNNILKSNFYKYLKDIINNFKQFPELNNKRQDYSQIKFSWERELSPQITKIAEETDILIIIGYSFPQYNMVTDRKIIDAFKLNQPMYLKYQDPTDDIDEVFDFLDFKNSFHSKSTFQFYIPDDFINQKNPENFIIF